MNKEFWDNKEREEPNVLIGWRKKRADPLQRKIFSYFFKKVFFLLFPTSIHDPSTPFVLFKKKIINEYINYLTYLNEGFWWGFVGLCVKKKLTGYEIPINHRKRIKGQTQVYKIKNIFDIAVRNFIGLLKLRLSK